MIFTSRGSFLALNLGVKVNVFHKDKKVREVKPVKEVPVVKIPVVPVPVKPQPLPEKVEGRKVVISHRLEVASGSVTISVWDNEKVDGDRISLNLNGQWIVTDYTLEKNKKTFTVTLKPGENMLVLHALNLGKIKPNTAAMIVNDGHTQQTLLLESDMQSSGTVIIDYK